MFDHDTSLERQREEAENSLAFECSFCGGAYTDDDSQPLCEVCRDRLDDGEIYETTTGAFLGVEE